ncbi:endoglucanase-like isoform X2 [Magnolia sinica]|uniref:endoglucanase-like isoform X2 n=1 Tax=Magnolia sinica TaxID=86752 RepID=UPI0026580FCA|nr:endoglucanase-like isoform X2 [Magnolia sinica]
MGTGAVVIVVAVVWGAAASGVLLAVEDEKAAFNYGDALEKAILFFEGQRSGKLPHNQRVKWRGDSGLSDGMLDQVKLVGGYYDAGDNIKFGWPVSFSITLLSWAVVEFKEQISSANQLSYLLSTIRWGTDFLMRAHTSPTTLYTQIGDGNSDHQCWERPEDMDTPRTLYKITATSPGTEVAGEAAAALASASLAFKDVDSNYSSILLISSISDELLWAAAWLFKASKDSKYMRFVMENQGWSQPVSEFSWDNKFAGAQTLLAKEYVAGNTKLGNYKSDADSFVCALMPGSSTVQIQTTKGGLLYTRDNNNMQYATSASLILLVYSKTIHGGGFGTIQCGSLYFSAIQIRAFAKSQVDYILGKNPLGMSYMVGFGVKYPMQLHHRGASIPSIRAHPTKVGCSEGYSTWYAANMPNPNTHVGAIVGGPNSNDQFNDIRSDYSHLEPTTYSNAAFIGSLAAMLGGNGCLQVIGTHANHTNLLVM